MSHSHTIVMAVPLRVVVTDAQSADQAIEKARLAVGDWLAQCPPGSSAPEYRPTVLSLSTGE